MVYQLDFDQRALKEWRKLGSAVREQFKKKIAQVLKAPRIEANRLHHFYLIATKSNCALQAIVWSTR